MFLQRNINSLVTILAHLKHSKNLCRTKIKKRFISFSLEHMCVSVLLYQHTYTSHTLRDLS